MPRYNDTFKLNLRDIELIEHALHEQIHELAHANLSPAAGGVSQNADKIREYQELLGKLHNQKIWYGQVHQTGVPLG